MAIRHAGPTIGAAGLILAGYVRVPALAGNALLSEMGFALSFGIVIAAFVMALLFTPALTALIGHAAWWPGHGDRATKPDAAAAGARPDAGARGRALTTVRPHQHVRRRQRGVAP